LEELGSSARSSSPGFASWATTPCRHRPPRVRHVHDYGGAHEHLGQLVAYARENGIVPPWTAEAKKAAEKKAEQK